MRFIGDYGELNPDLWDHNPRHYHYAIVTVGEVGVEPTHVDFQSTASTELASLPKPYDSAREDTSFFALFAFASFTKLNRRMVYFFRMTWHGKVPLSFRI